MRIIREPDELTLPDGTPLEVQWWLQRIATCPECNAQIQLEEEDEIRNRKLRLQYDSYEVPCPFCFHWIYERRDKKTLNEYLADQFPVEPSTVERIMAWWNTR